MIILLLTWIIGVK